MPIVFVCSWCGNTIHRDFKPGQPVGLVAKPNTCTICDWINNNPELTLIEKEQLRKKLCYEQQH